MKKLSVLLTLAFVSMILIFAASNPVSAQQTVEDQYWELIKDSNNPQDFESYLKEYPDGKYAPLARLKVNKGKSTVSFLSYKSATNGLNNMQFMKGWESEFSPQLPLKYGEYEIYRTAAPTSVENYYYNSARTTNANSPKNIRSQAGELKDMLLADYCRSEAYQRNITVVLGFRDNRSGYAKHLTPRDCSTNTPKAQQTDAQYLNTWASEVRIGLPEMVGGFQLTDAWSRCPSGCQEKDSPIYLLLKFKALNDQINAPIDNLKASLMPVLLEEYCETDAVKRNIGLGVFFDNRGTGADYNNFWVYPKDCPAKTTN